jgi:hypothetical protein
MKKFILATFIAALLSVSCNNEELPDTFEIGSEQEFQFGELNQSDDNSLKFSITEINDSRCPSDVVCVWQGAAVVKIDIKNPQPAVIRLSTFDNLVDTVGKYSIKLVDVSPYPISTQSIELKDYHVILKIEEIQN